MLTATNGLARLKDALRHVLWIGGPPDAGKSTVADLLAEQYDLSVYHFDRNEPDHLRRADPVRHPAVHALARRLEALGTQAWAEEFWVQRDVEQITQDTMASWSQRVDLAVEDLGRLSGDRPIIAEGPGFFPEVTLPLLSGDRQAIWLVPSEAFKRASHARRGKSAWRIHSSDPETAYRNHVERDLLIGQHYRRSTAELRLPLIEVDGSVSPEQVAADVAAHFAPTLTRMASGCSGERGP